MRRALLLLAACGAPAKPPTATPCEQAAPAIVAAAVAAPDAKMTSAISAAIARSCADDHWTGDAIACFEHAEHRSDVDLCRTSLSDDQQAHWGVSLVRSIEPDAFPPDIGVDACDDYLRHFDTFARCGRLSDAQLEAAVLALDPRVRVWRDLAHRPMIPDARRRAIENECEQGLDRLRASAAAAGCSI